MGKIRLGCISVQFNRMLDSGISNGIGFGERLLWADSCLPPKAALGRSLPVMLAKGADKSVKLPRCQWIGIGRSRQR
jgi:hypothetical protein